MKIVQIMPEFGLAGAEIMCENLVYELVKLGHEVIVISMYDYHSAITERMESCNIDIRYLGKKSGLDLSVTKKIYKILKDEKPDVIHTHRYVMRYVIPAAKMAKTPRLVHTVHSVAQKECGRIDQIINKYFYKFCNVVPVALSKLVQDTVCEVYNRKSNETPIIYNGINLDKCERKSEYQLNQKIRILHIGRFADVKNHRGLIEAFDIFQKKYKNSELLLIGEGELRNSMEAMVDQLDLANKVKFLGLKSEVCSYLKHSDIFVLPSFYEGIPMSLIEAMGTGIPIVATKVGGIPDMLESEKNALLVDVNSEMIANACERIVEDHFLREKIGSNALVAAEEFSSIKMANEYIKVYASRQ